MPPANKNTASVRPADLLVPNPKLKLREQFHEVMRFKHYSVRTEESYWGWVRQFLVFHREGRVRGGTPRTAGGTPALPGAWRHPRALGVQEVQGFLTPLAAERAVAPSTQNQALNALVFL